MSNQPATPPPPGYPPIIPTGGSLQSLHQVMVGCTRCDLFLSRTQVVPGSGHPTAKILLIGEAPGAAEDLEGVPFVGRSGALLTAMLARADILRQDVFIANVIRCRPPANRPPRPAELRACAGWLDEQLRLVRPRLVVSLGRFAYQHFVPGGSVTQAQGRIATIDGDAGPLTLYPLLHPSAILRDPRKRPAYEEQFRAIPAILKGLGTESEGDRPASARTAHPDYRRSKTDDRQDRQ